MAVRGFEQDIINNFSLGVISAVLKDRLPDGAVPSAKNSQFYNIGPERANFGTRQGCQVQNETSVGSAIVSQYFLNAGTNYHLLVDADGNLKKLVSGTVSTITSSLFTEVDNPFSWQTVGNYAYVVNGEDSFKTDGTTSYRFGMPFPFPSDWSISSVAGGGNLPTDTYDLTIAYYNENTGVTGPISTIKTISITNPNRIQVVLPSAATIAAFGDTQVTHTKIYIRRQSTTTNLWYVAAGTDVADDNGQGWTVGVGTTTVKIDATAAEMLAFTIIAPGPNENMVPAEMKFIANHRSRLFGAKGNDLLWSKEGQPENFNDTDDSIPVGEDDGEEITGLVEFKEVLVIFKQSAIYVLVGTDPQTWAIELVDKTVGCVAYPSIGQVDNKLFWMSLQGPQMWVGAGSQVSDITTELIGPSFDETHIAPSELVNSVIIGHPTQNYVAWAVTPVTETNRNTLIIPFNFKTQRWMSSEWNMVDVRSSTIVLDSDGRPWPMVGDYDGTIYKVGVGDDDGIPSSFITTGTLTAATSTTLTDSTATWGTDTLIGRYVYVWDDSQGFSSQQRKRITTNTGTVLTVDSDFLTLPTAGNNYSLGGIFFDWRSAFRDGGGPFFRKRIEFLFIEVATETTGVTVEIETYIDMHDDNPVSSRTVSIDTGGMYDEDLYDEAYFSGFGTIRKRIPIRKVGYNWQTRLLHISNGGGRLQVYTIGTQWLTKTKKTGQSHI